jgi:YHS domain-containing protein
MRLSTLGCWVLACFALASCLEDDSSRSGLAAYNLDAKGVALAGYSPVSYVDEGRAEPGDPAFARSYRGITYLFASAAQETAFAADPERYEPQYGGWCAYGLTVGIRWKPDPDNFKVVNGKLLLFSRTGDADARRLWEREADEAALLRRADEYWRSLRSE